MKNYNTAERLRACWNRALETIVSAGTSARWVKSARSARRSSRVYLFDADFSDDVAVAVSLRSPELTQTDLMNPDMAVERTNGSVTKTN